MTELYLLFTVLLWGIAPILEKAALQGGAPVAGTIIRSMSVGMTMAAVALFSGKFREIAVMPGKNILLFAASGLMAGGLGIFTYYRALQHGPTSKIVPLASTYPLVTAVLSVVLLGEKLTFGRTAGIILIVAGILLVE